MTLQRRSISKSINYATEKWCHFILCQRMCIYPAFNPTFLFILIFFRFFLFFPLFIWIFLRSIELEADQISLMSCSCNKMDEKHPYLPKWCIEKGVMDTFCHKKTFLWNVTNYENTSFFGDFTKNHPSVLSVVVCFVMGVWFGSKDWQT